MSISGPPGRRWLSLWLNALGVVVVGTALGNRAVNGTMPWWAVALGALSLAAWASSIIIPADRVVALRIAFILTALAPAIPVSMSDGILTVPVLVGVLRCTARPNEPSWLGQGTALTAAALIAVGALFAPEDLAGNLIAPEVGVLVAFFGGMNRRQARQRQQHAAQMAQKEAEMRDEQARLEALSSRQYLARELHDVLAHSLGGLVIQLDAADALLESGRAGDAHERVRAARELAASGLGEARRAVAVLREPAEEHPPVAGDALNARVRELITTHQGLGETAHLRLEGVPRQVSGLTAAAFTRAVQESLSNARKHATGAPVSVELTWGERELRLRVSSPLVADAAPTALAASGSGRGLRGMEERFALVESGRVRAGIEESPGGPLFVVEAEATIDGAPAAHPPSDPEQDRSDTHAP